MMRLSLSLGRWMGAEVRLHISFLLLLLVAVLTGLAMGNAARGLGLWLALVFAVFVREASRAIVAAYSGLKIRAMILFPVGGVIAFAPRRGGMPNEDNTRAVTFAGPFGNACMFVLMLGAAYAFQPGLHLFAQPWIGFSHILRSFLWTQAAIAAIGALPSVLPLKALAPKSKDDDLDAKRRVGFSFNIGSILALVLTLAGLLTLNLWLAAVGAFLLLGSQLAPGQRVTPTETTADSVRVREVMLTEFTLLNTSDTLMSAIDRTVHSLQDVFPIVRGNQLVGSVARGTLVEAFHANGEAYLQGIMTRTLNTAAPEEALVEALRRSAALGASELIPVVDEGALIGVLTPQSLARSVALVRTTAPRQVL